MRGIYHWGNTVWNYAAVGELTLRGLDYGMTCQNQVSPGACNFIRVVGNDMRSLEGGSTAFDFEVPANTISVYGNESAQNCLGAANCTFDNRAYSMYFGGYGLQTNIDIGWNRLHDNPFGKASITVQNGGLRITMAAPAEVEDGRNIPPIDMQPIGELECVVTEGEYAGMRVDFITHPDSDKLRWARFGGSSCGSPKWPRACG